VSVQVCGLEHAHGEDQYEMDSDLDESNHNALNSVDFPDSF